MKDMRTRVFSAFILCDVYYCNWFFDKVVWSHPPFVCPFDRMEEITSEKSRNENFYTWAGLKVLPPTNDLSNSCINFIR